MKNPKFYKGLIYDLVELQKALSYSKSQEVEMLTMRHPLDILDLCEKIYDEPGIGTPIKAGRNYCEIIQDNKDTATIVFRGTDNFRNILTDINCFDLNWNNVHDGFERAFGSLRSKIHEYLVYGSETKITKLNMYGHSLGGALAVLYAKYFSGVWVFGEGTYEVNCITFGAPRVGGRQFREEFRQSGVNCIQYQIPLDHIPNLPTKAQGYRHVGRVVKLKHKWYDYLRPFGWHKTEMYCKLLNRKD